MVSGFFIAQWHPVRCVAIHAERWVNKKQEKLFNEYPAARKLVIDSVEKLEVLSEI